MTRVREFAVAGTGEGDPATAPRPGGLAAPGADEDRFAAAT